MYKERRAGISQRWSKLATILSLCIVIPLVNFNAGELWAQLSGDFKGTFILAFYDQNSWSSNYYSVDLQVSMPRWHLTIKSANNTNNFHQETFASADRVLCVTYYDDVSPTSHLNTSEIKVFKGGRPLSARIEEHIWAALFSNDFFKGKKPPFSDIGLCIEEPCIFTEVQFNNMDVSPRLAKWHNERADKDSSGTRIEGEFQWLNQTNFENIEVPAKSELTIDIIYSDGRRRPASFSQLTIDDRSSPTSSPEQSPITTGRSAIYDYRVGGELDKIYVPYNTVDGKIPDVHSPKVQAVMKALSVKDSQPPKNSFVRYTILTIFLLSSIGFFIFALLTKKQHKNKYENTKTK